MKLKGAFPAYGVRYVLRQTGDDWSGILAFNSHVSESEVPNIGSAVGNGFVDIALLFTFDAREKIEGTGPYGLIFATPELAQLTFGLVGHAVELLPGEITRGEIR